MYQSVRTGRVGWLAVGVGIGLVVGLMAAGLWPHVPLHAVATDRNQTFAMATGPVDEEVEAVYLLDFLTGDLRAVVLGRQGGAFTNFYSYPGPSLLRDLGIDDPSKNLRFMMATGMANLRRGSARMQPSLAVVYVAEVTSGRMAAYGIPWSKGLHAAGQIVRQHLVLLAVTPFRAPAGAAVGAAPGNP